MNQLMNAEMTVRTLRAALIAVLLAALVLYLIPAPAAHGATITVNSTADVVADDGQCTLREAITAANADSASGSMTGECIAGSGDDIITLPAGTYTLALSGTGEDNNATGDLDVTGNLTINGAGATSTIIDGGAIDRVFHIFSGVTVEINDLKITNGSNTVGGAIYNFGGTLTLNNTTVSGNTAGATGGGGGVYNNGGTLTLNHSTISNNTADYGGGIYNYWNTAVLTLNNSTVSDNTAGAKGGGISNNRGTLTLNNSTVSGNTATGGAEPNDGGGGIYNIYGTVTLDSATIANNATQNGDGGGIDNVAGTVNLKNAIVGGNTDSGGQAPDCSGTLTSQGYNLIQDTTGCTFSTATGDITGQDPKLSPLADNGGPTQTHALQSGSPAIDQIPDGTSGCQAGVSTDQRGAVRADGPGRGGSACDMGAYEYDSSQTPTVIRLQTFTARTGAGTRLKGLPLGLLLLGTVGLPLLWRLRRRAA